MRPTGKYSPQPLQPLHSEHEVLPNDDYWEKLRSSHKEFSLLDRQMFVASRAVSDGSKGNLLESSEITPPTTCRVSLGTVGELLEVSPSEPDSYKKQDLSESLAANSSESPLSLPRLLVQKSLSMGQLLSESLAKKSSCEPNEIERREKLDSSICTMQVEPSGLSVRPLRSSSSVNPSEGRLEGTYLLERVLGKGGFGEVSLATCKESGEQRAVKSVSQCSSLGFQNEFMIAKKVKHENIVQLHGMFLHDDKCFLVMDMCSGGDLLAFIKSRYHFAFGHQLSYRAPQPYEVAAIFWQMLQAIRYLHFYLIVHRDIKADNFLFESLREGAPIKLIDFGLAASMKAGFSLVECVGTRGYLAPEMLGGNGYNELVDVWSLGVVAFIVCVGEFPIDIREELGNDAEAMLKVTNETAIDFDKLKNHSFPIHVTNILKLVLERDPSARPQAKNILATNIWLRRHGRATTRQACCVCF